jgi:hypothetical protein
MPFDHVGNTANGNQLSGGGGASTGSLFKGRTTNLPIYEVRLGALSACAQLKASTLMEIVKSLNKSAGRDSTARRTDHDDNLGNLPDAPGTGITYREYHVGKTAFSKPGYVRLVADFTKKRLFITPTHYDLYLVDSAAATLAPIATGISSTAVGAHNPFFLITGVGAFNPFFY